MGRLKARLAKNPSEGEILREVAQAERYLQRSIDLIRKHRKNPDLKLARLSDLENRVKAALKLLDNLPSLTSKVDKSDPDLLSPKERREAKRLARIERKGRGRR
tara:strand:- start:136 stop:447 length:312 start_codon:yes stop_codon:yes gene_type:complete